MSFLTYMPYIIVVIMTIFYFTIKRRYSYWKSRGIPYLHPSFPYGNSSRRHFVYDMDKIYTNLKGKTPFVGAYFFINPTAVATDLDFVKNILIKDFNTFPDRGLFYNERDDPLSAHLVNLDGEKWRLLRSKLSPTFTSGKMKFMFPTVVEVGYRFNETLHETLRTESEIEMKELLARFTTDVIGNCAFGIECNSLKDPNAEFRVYGKETFENQSRFGRRLKAQFPQLAKLLRLKRNSDKVIDFFMGVVRETVDLREKNNIKRNDFMDILIELKNSKDGLTLNEIAAQAFVFFLAGFETSSTASAYSLYELSFNQEIQNKARHEVLTAIQKHNGQFTYEAMMEMTYIDQIISESIRKYPPAIALTRKAIGDYQVPGTNYTIEKGMSVMVPVYQIHHDPDVFSNPETFDPDRFLPEAIKERHPLSFLGFGDGPRNCIGLRFGRMQSRIALAILLQNYKFFPSAKSQVPLKFDVRSFILQPEGGFWLKVVPA